MADSANSVPATSNDPSEVIEDDGFIYHFDRRCRVYYRKEDSNPYCLSDWTYPEKEEEEVCPSMSTDEVNKPTATWYDLKVNTNVYVTGLPPDVTVDEDHEKKQFCVKIYLDKETGRQKGDGLVKFLKEASVDLAIQILDGMPLRLGDTITMSVTRAIFEPRVKGQFLPVLKNPKKEKIKKQKLRQVEYKLLGWGGHDDSKRTIPATIILSNMFTLDEMMADDNLSYEVEKDVGDKCSRLGPVESIKPDGVVLVEFKDRKDAKKCIELMNGRWYAKETNFCC